jgi:hypothetical protein
VELNFLDSSHEMPVMILMGIVVAKHAAIVSGANSSIDVGQAVLHHAPAFVPDFFLEHCAFSLAREMQRLINAFLPLATAFRSLSSHNALWQL